MNIIICDDMKPEIARLEKLLRDSGFVMNIKSFDNGHDVVDYIKSGVVVDLCFLDIVMPQMSGVELARQMRMDGFNGEIVFLTSSNEYAAQSYGVKAFDYLLKPPGREAVYSVLESLENERRSRDTNGILVKVAKVARHILFRDISHVEVIRHYVYIRLTNGEEVEIYATFAEIARQLLSDSRFVQCHRSYIVNLNDIASIDERDISLRTGMKIPYSKTFSDIKKEFTKWIIGGGHA